jgi:uncharacterized membrane protein
MLSTRKHYCQRLRRRRDGPRRAVSLLDTASARPPAGMTPASTQPVIHTLADAPWFVLMRLALALAALAVGTLILLRRKGDLPHKRLGRTWVGLMLAAASISFLIQARGRFNLIHILSVLILIIVPLGVVHIRRKRVTQHRYSMIGAFAGLAIAGAFNLLPYRMLGQLVFGHP